MEKVVEIFHGESGGETHFQYANSKHYMHELILRYVEAISVVIILLLLSFTQDRLLVNRSVCFLQS